MIKKTYSLTDVFPSTSSSALVPHRTNMRKSVIVVGPSGGSGKTTVASILASVSAQASENAKTVVIDLSYELTLLFLKSMETEEQRIISNMNRARLHTYSSLVHRSSVAPVQTASSSLDHYDVDMLLDSSSQQRDNINQKDEEGELAISSLPCVWPDTTKLVFEEQIYQDVFTYWERFPSEEERSKMSSMLHNSPLFEHNIANCLLNFELWEKERTLAPGKIGIDVKIAQTNCRNIRIIPFHHMLNLEMSRFDGKSASTIPLLSKLRKFFNYLYDYHKIDRIIIDAGVGASRLAWHAMLACDEIVYTERCSPKLPHDINLFYCNFDYYMTAKQLFRELGDPDPILLCLVVNNAYRANAVEVSRIKEKDRSEPSTKKRKRSSPDMKTEEKEEKTPAVISSPISFSTVFAQLNRENFGGTTMGFIPSISHMNCIDVGMATLIKQKSNRGTRLSFQSGMIVLPHTEQNIPPNNFEVVNGDWSNLYEMEKDANFHDTAFIISFSFLFKLVFPSITERNRRTYPPVTNPPPFISVPVSMSIKNEKRDME